MQAERDTVKEREALEREEELALELERQRLEQRKLQTKEIVVDTIAKEEAAARAAAEVRPDIAVHVLHARLAPQGICRCTRQGQHLPGCVMQGPDSMKWTGVRIILSTRGVLQLRE